MKNIFLKKIAAIAFGALISTTTTSSAFAFGSYGETDESDGCDIGFERVSETTTMISGYTPEGKPIYVVTIVTFCKKIR